MRIISGQLSGRTFDQPTASTTRPMSEKLRAAVFDILGPIEGLTVLDAYSGSGALGFEALSRGAGKVVAVESSAKVAKIIQANCKTLGQDSRHKLISKSVEQWQYQNPGQLFDLILADPPYEQLQLATLNRFAGHLTKNGLLVVSHTSKMSSPTLQSLSLVKSRAYGDSALSFYSLSEI